jgi:hypothetical protein
LKVDIRITRLRFTEVAEEEYLQKGDKTGGKFGSTFKIQDIYLRLSTLTLMTYKVIMNIRRCFSEM